MLDKSPFYVKSINVIQYIFVILTVLNCNSVFYTELHGGYNSHTIFNILWMFILIFLFFNSLKKYKRHTLNLKIEICCYIFIFLIYMIILFFININYINIFNMINMLFSPIFLVILFCVDKNNSSLLIKAENFILVLAGISLVFWAMSIIGIPTNSHITIGWNGVHSINGYFGFHFIAQGKVNNFIGFSNVIRNTGLFSEAPMYSYVLCIALLIELFVRDTKNIVSWRVVLLFIAILSTTSTTGLIVLLPAILFKYIVSSNNLVKQIIFALLIPLVLFIIKIAMVNKIGDVTNVTTSYGIRMNDIYATTHAWIQHIFIGNGIGNDNAIKQFMYGWRLLPGGNDGLSTGFLSVLAYGGIFYSLFYLIPTLLMLRCSFDDIGLAIFSFILLIYTMVPSSFLYICILSYFVSIFIKYVNEKKPSWLNDFMNIKGK